VTAQTLLTADQAVDLALQRNYEVRIARNAADAAAASNTLGNAGMLPNADLTGAGKYAAGAGSLKADATLTWTLFDGGRMFVTKTKLSQIQALGEIEFRDQVLQTVYDVTEAYYDVVRQKQQLSSINEVISTGEERVKILQTGFQSGQGPKAGLLQARIDLNVLREKALAQQVTLKTSRRTLNRLLGREAGTAFEVADSIPLGPLPDRRELTEKLSAGNTQILSARQQWEIAKLAVMENQARRWPRAAVQAGFTLYPADTAADISRNAQVTGTVTVPLFQGGNISRQVKAAKIQEKSAEATLENAQLNAESQLQNALDILENQQAILAIEKENVLLARENLDIALGRLRLGQSTSLDLKLAEESYMDSQTRLVNFTYSLKLVETKIKQLIAGM
jgi:outer membrane protein TolC